MASLHHSCHLSNAELLESSLDTFLEAEGAVVDHRVKPLALKVVLHYAEGSFDRVELRAVWDVPNQLDTEIFRHVLHGM